MTGCRQSGNVTGKDRQLPDGQSTVVEQNFTQVGVGIEAEEAQKAPPRHWFASVHACPTATVPFSGRQVKAVTAPLQARLHFWPPRQPDCATGSHAGEAPSVPPLPPPPAPQAITPAITIPATHLAHLAHLADVPVDGMVSARTMP